MVVVAKEPSLEMPLRTHAELKRYHENVIKIATPMINAFLGIKDKEELSPLAIKYDEGTEVEAFYDNGSWSIVFRPFKRLEKVGRPLKPDDFTVGATIHEIAHTVENEFTGLPPQRNTDTATYLRNGFAEFIRMDDPAKIKIAFGLPHTDNSYTRLRRAINRGDTFGKTLSSYLSLDKLFSTKQPNIEGEDNLPPDLKAKSDVPYLIGGSLVRFIYDKGGLEAVRYIMRKVQVDERFSFGWKEKWQTSNTIATDDLEDEEKRVNALLKSAIYDRFGDVDKFEQEWRDAVMGKDESPEEIVRLIQGRLQQAGEVRPGQIPTPKQQFFAALAKPENFSTFQSLVAFEHNSDIYSADWEFVHYFSAFIYTLSNTNEGKRFVADKNFNIFTSPQSQWGEASNLVLTDKTMSEEFKKSTRRHMQSTFPHLAIPARLILNRLFGNQKDLVGYDLGCGPHIDLPALANEYLPPNYHFPSNINQEYDKPVPIARGIGVDLEASDIDWIKACGESAQADTQEEALRIDNEMDKLVKLRTDQIISFPFITADILTFNPPELADFVITKKMRYQLGEENQDAIKQVINNSLKEGGYWITIGEENFFTDGTDKFLNSDDEIWVYQKHNGELERRKVPTIKISKQTREISDFNEEFFGISK